MHLPRESSLNFLRREVVGHVFILCIVVLCCFIPQKTFCGSSGWSPLVNTLTMPSPNEDYRAFNLWFIEENRINKFVEIPGPETVIKIYCQPSFMFALYSFENGKVYAYAIIKDGNMTLYVDKNANGMVDWIVHPGTSATVDLEQYGISP